MPPVVMLIRHAEKPWAGGDQGVDNDGTPDPESLTPRGWQRAGALISLFVGGPLATPTHLFASKIGPQSSSRRPVQTLQPVGDRLGLRTNTTYLKEELGQLVQAIRRVDGVVLVSWEHHLIPSIANGLLGDASVVPQIWPDDRFDLVWIIDLATDDKSGRFRQVPQLLLHGDLGSAIVGDVARVSPETSRQR